jgi:allophanate hydrolase
MGSMSANSAPPPSGDRLAPDPRAWLMRLPQDLADASTAAAQPATAQHEAARLPLAGLRFAVKDNIDVAGLPTTAACPAFAYTPSAHAHVVQRLLSAGALLAGKTNLDQFACGLNGTRSPHGAVANAFSTAHVSGGSSSGSAHVVATGQVDFALGTDTAGSGRVPAGLNNIIGVKPSKGLISTRGVLPAARSVDCVSIFARRMEVAAQVLACAMGHDPADPYSRDFSRSDALHTQPWPATFKFGVPAQLAFFGDEQAPAEFEQALRLLEGLGGQRLAIDYTPLREAASLLYDSALVAERYAAIRGFFDAHAEEVIEPVRSIIERGRHYSAADVFEAQDRLQALRAEVQPMWANIDVLVVPTVPKHVRVADMQANPVNLNRELGEYTNFVNLLDHAAVSVPSSLRPDGLPFGITLIAPCGHDWRLMALGQRVHQASGMTEGALGTALPAPQPLVQPPTPSEARREAAATIEVAVVGAHLSGMPLNGQLTERGARLLRTARTTADYRLYALDGTTPPKPGLLRVAPGSGAGIELEVWSMPLAAYGSFVALIPSPLGIGTLTLEDGSRVQGFLCEAQALEAAQDITAFGGWRAYMQQRTASA